MITLAEVKRKQAELSRQGKAILKKYDILRRLEPLGDVHLYGSLKYGLMVKPDIDFHILTPNPNLKMVAQVANDFILDGRTKRTNVVNFLNFDPKPGMPKVSILAFSSNMIAKSGRLMPGLPDQKTRRIPKTFLPIGTSISVVRRGILFYYLRRSSNLKTVTQKISFRPIYIALS